MTAEYVAAKKAADEAAEKAAHKAMKAEHEAAEQQQKLQQQQQQQQQQQRPHSSLNISGAGVRSLPCTPPASSADISGGCGAAAAT